MNSSARGPGACRGVTLLELLVTLVILFILGAAVLPMTRISDRRTRELELRQQLRELRQALDRFKLDWDLKRLSQLESDVANPDNGYPKTLEILVKGAPSGDSKGAVRKYLRRIPEDPITGTREWGLRCYSDEPDSTSWCGDDVYDIYSKGEGSALDGTSYRDW